MRARIDIHAPPLGLEVGIRMAAFRAVSRLLAEATAGELAGWPHVSEG